MRRILLVDDNPSSAKLLARMVRACGYELETAPNCAEALDRVRNRPPALVLLDIKYPRLLGRSFLDELARLSPGLPVLTLAGNDDEIIAQLVGKLCGAGYLLKPVEPEALQDALTSRLGESEPESVSDRRGSPARSLLGWLPAFSEMGG